MNNENKVESTAFVRKRRKKIPLKTQLIRICVIAILTVLICIFLLRPMFINGGSMIPTYKEHGFTFCFLPYFYLTDPHRGQVVCLSLASPKYYLLKRVLAFPGETVAFRRGVLYVNGKPQEEPYVKLKCNWELSERVVPPGKLFVVGDNRSMPLKSHLGGLIDEDRLVGIPIW